MPDDSERPDGDVVDSALAEITARCFAANDEIVALKLERNRFGRENALLRRLVLSMALNIDADFLAADERRMLLEIMGEH